MGPPRPPVGRRKMVLFRRWAWGNVFSALLQTFPGRGAAPLPHTRRSLARLRRPEANSTRANTKNVQKRASGSAHSLEIARAPYVYMAARERAVQAVRSNHVYTRAEGPYSPREISTVIQVGSYPGSRIFPRACISKSMLFGFGCRYHARTHARARARTRTRTRTHTHAYSTHTRMRWVGKNVWPFRSPCARVPDPLVLDASVREAVTRSKAISA